MSGSARRLVVIGVGNSFRRDDGVGPAVIERLRRRAPVGVELAESDGEPSRLIELWAGADLAIVVDAVHTVHAQPGRIHQRQLDRARSSRARPASSHRVDLGDAVALAQAVDRMPAVLVMYGVEVEQTGFGPELTPAVAAAADMVAAAIAARLHGDVIGQRYGDEPGGDEPGGDERHVPT